MRCVVNSEIKEKIKSNNLKQYQVAEKIGISEFTFVRWLRNELSEEKKELVLNAINELASEN